MHRVHFLMVFKKSPLNRMQSVHDYMTDMVYNREQIAFCSMGFFEIPLENGLYASVSPKGGDHNDLP